MTITASVVDRATDSLGEFLPRLGGGLLLLVIGIVAARIVGRLLERALLATGMDDLADRFGVAEVLDKAKLGRSLSRLIGRAVRLGLTAVVVFAALSLLGLQFLSDSLNAAVLLLPNLAVAGVLLLAGVVLGGLARERADRLTREMDLPFPVGTAAQVVVVGVFAITAAAQVAVSTAILMALVGIILAGAMATVALSFGIGGSGIARELTASRYLRTGLEPGQLISFDDVRGEVVRVESATTILRGAAGETIRVPNAMLLGAVVTVSEVPEEA